ncbi:MAG: tetratricopeptide repeat protein [Pirellulaceae bacterium]|nr:tetratricopeptide repeat protein [Pirellulaceae bacterium]
MQFLFFLRQLLMLPVDLIRFIFNTINDFQNATPRVKALMFSIPALFTAVVGLTFLGIASTIRESTLLTRYTTLAEQTNTEFNQEYSEFIKYNQKRFEELTANADPEKPLDGKELAENLNQDSGTVGLRKKLEELRKTEILFREKLVHLQPSNEEYKFQHAMAHRVLDDQRMLTLLNAIAPTDRPGHLKAHLWLAEYYFVLAQNQQANLQARLYSEAITQANNALMLEKENQTALRIKGDSLFRIGRYELAHEVYTMLVRLDPTTFWPIVELNELRGVSASDTEIFLRSMKIELGKKMKINRNVISTWERHLVAYVQCLLRLEEYSEIRRELDEELEMASTFSDTRKVRETVINNLWAHTLINENSQRTANLKRDGRKMTQQIADGLINNFRTILEITPNSDDIKRQVVALAVEYPEFKDSFYTVYNPQNDPSPPPFVVDRLGVAELLAHNYTTAIQLLKQALDLSPDDPTIMNNLAFAYLSLNTQEGVERALWYSEMALQTLDRKVQFRRQPELMSNFNHTRGSALMAGGQYAEAVGFFENALIGRPNHRSSLEALVRCLTQIGSPKAAEYQKILDELDRNQDFPSPRP